MHVGKEIRRVMTKRGHSVSWLASCLHTVRGNVYDIFERESVDTRLLARISVLLHFNFFLLLSDEVEKDIEESVSS